MSRWLRSVFPRAAFNQITGPDKPGCSNRGADNSQHDVSSSHRATLLRSPHKRYSRKGNNAPAKISPHLAGFVVSLHVKTEFCQYPENGEGYGERENQSGIAGHAAMVITGGLKKPVQFT